MLKRFVKTYLITYMFTGCRRPEKLTLFSTKNGLGLCTYTGWGNWYSGLNSQRRIFPEEMAYLYLEICIVMCWVTEDAVLFVTLVLFTTSLVVTTICFYNVLGPSDVVSRSGPGSSALVLWIFFDLRLWSLLWYLFCDLFCDLLRWYNRTSFLF
jgi:hypothetical protein